MEDMGADQLNMEEQVGDSSRSREEEVESRSSGSGTVREESKEEDEQGKRKQFHRHTAHQIQQMELFFKDYQHPDEKQRLRLSQELGLTPRQVKFWFQNRRTQMKAQQDRVENLSLRNENENLKAENYKLRVALRNFSCANCSGNSPMGEMGFDQAHQLQFENASLREEIARIYGVPVSNRPVNPEPVHPSLDLDIGGYTRNLTDALTLSTGTVSPSTPLPVMAYPENPSIVLLESEMSLALELAVHATDQVLRMSREGEPLWTRVGGRSREVLNLEEHSQTFHWPVNKIRPSAQNLRTEATRDTALVFTNILSLVNAFMDAETWMMMFPSLVARTCTIQIISRGAGTDPNGQVQLMHAEFMYPSPLLMTRECYFLRACHQAPEGMWVVVDFPIDGFTCAATEAAFARFLRHPSGVVIDDVSNGYCRATWVEHVEAEDRPLHPILGPLLLGGGAFSAQRWIAALQRYAERAALTSPHAFHGSTGIINSIEGRRHFMHLSQRMLKMFCISISTGLRQPWTPPLGSPSDDTIRMTTRRSAERGHPHGTILSAVSATWLPFSHFQVFEFLRSEKSRSKLEAFSGGSSFQEISRITTGSHPGNYIALLRINSPNVPAGSSTDLMLQESFIDSCGSMIAYAPVGARVVETVMTSGDTSYIPLLPCGFFILPASSNSNATPVAGGMSGASDARSGTSSQADTVYSNGCILTVAFQVLASASPASKISMTTVSSLNNHIYNAVRQIHDAIKASAVDAFSSPDL